MLYTRNFIHKKSFLLSLNFFYKIVPDHIFTFFFTTKEEEECIEKTADSFCFKIIHLKMILFVLQVFFVWSSQCIFLCQQFLTDCHYYYYFDSCGWLQKLHFILGLRLFLFYFGNNLVITITVITNSWS